MSEKKVPDETLFEYNELDGTNTLILPSSKEERKRLHQIRTKENNPKVELISSTKKMSKRKKRKLQQLEKKRLDTAFQVNINNEIKKYSLNNMEIMLMMGVSNHKMTKKQKEMLRKRFEQAKQDIPEFLREKIPKSHTLPICSGTEGEEYSEEEDEDTEMNNSEETHPSVEIMNECDVNDNIQGEEIIDSNDKQGTEISIKKSEELDEGSSKKCIRKLGELKMVKVCDRPKVTRTPEIESQRSDLPVRVYEYEILDSIENNDFLIVTGTTGSGKSTQVPQLLYEMGYCPFRCEASASNGKRFMIGLTQPRRIAAMSLSKRIGEELNDPEVVGYQVRYDNTNYTEKTVIKVMTDGILLQEIQKDLLCSKYSVIIIDEAHERTVNTDILIGLLSKIVVYRRLEYEKNKLECDKGNNIVLPPLKLIIMSATLRVTDFSENPKLFKKPPPIVDIETPNYPITIHFSKNTPTDYILASYKKIMQIHKKLPPGSILVFVTGKKEVRVLVEMINGKLNNKGSMNSIRKNYRKGLALSAPNCMLDLKENDNEMYEEVDLEDFNDYSTESEDGAESEFDEEDEEEDIIQQESIDNITEDENTDKKTNNNTIWDDFSERDNRKRKIRLHKDVDPTVWKGGGFIDKEDGDNTEDKIECTQKKNDVLLKAIPLYASMSYNEQKEAFKLPESNKIRHVIISTNVSETSITIPNVRYVIDTGREKRRHYSKNMESSNFKVEWISKASSNQRSGRAGRIGPGHCYRLYSSPVYENLFPKFSPIDILSIPLDSILLYMHSLGIPDVFDFPFPTPPEKSQLEKSYELLKILGCIETTSGRLSLSKQGILMSKLPLPPRYGKFLLMTIAYIRKNMGDNFNQQIELLKQICIVVSFLALGNVRDNTVKEIGSSSRDEIKFENIPKSTLGNDIEVSLWLCLKYLEYYGSGTSKERKLSDEFCKNFGLNQRAMSEMRLMSQQLYDIAKNKYLYNQNDNNRLEGSEKSKKLWVPSFPNSIQKQVIRTFFISSFIDHVAVRNDGNLTNKTSYLTPDEVNDYSVKITIDSNSIIKGLKPKYLVYSQKISDNDCSKQNLYDCVLITPEDIIKATSLTHPLVDCSKLLTYPAPYYCSEHDKVFGYCIPRYRNNSVVIDLPCSKVEVNKLSNYCYDVLAKAILDGRVFMQLGDQGISEYLKVGSNSKAFKYFVHILQKNKACSKADITSILEKKRDFLLKEILFMYDISVHNKIRSFWPPI